MENTENSQSNQLSHTESNNNNINQQSKNVAPEPATLKNLKSYVTFKNLENSNSHALNDSISNVSGIICEDNNHNNDSENILDHKRNNNILVYRPQQQNKTAVTNNLRPGVYESVRNNKHFINGQENISNDFFSKKSNTQNPFGHLKSNFASQNTEHKSKNTITKYKKHINKIIKIQSYYRKYSFNKYTYSTLKPQLIDHLNDMVKELYNKYLTTNLKQAENAIGIQHNENSYKSLYSTGLSVGIGSAFVGGLRLYTKLLVLTYNKLPSFYVGEVGIDNSLHGKGILTQCDGTKYNGTFERGAFTGVGQMFNNKGVLFEGYFTKGKLDGRATKKSLNGCLYIGDFVNGVIEGNGKEECKEYLYEGQFAKNKKHGKGKIIYKQTGDIYEGEFREDAITGDGIYKWANGESYKGTVLNGKMHGKGLYKWPDGGEYEGDYNNNLKEGKGRFKWANGKIFEGEFRNGKPNGKGVLTTNNKEYNVIFKNGKLNGKISQLSESEEGTRRSQNNYMNSNNNNNQSSYEEEEEEESESINQNRKTKNRRLSINNNFNNKKAFNSKSKKADNNNNNINENENDGHYSDEDENDFPIKRSKGNMINVDEYEDNNKDKKKQQFKGIKQGNAATKYINDNVIKENNEESFESSSLDFVKKKKKVKLNGKNDNNKQEPILQLSNSVMSDDNSDSLQRNVTKEQIKKTGSDKYQTNQQLKQNKKIKNKY